MCVCVCAAGFTHLENKLIALLFLWITWAIRTGVTLKPSVFLVTWCIQPPECKAAHIKIFISCCWLYVGKVCSVDFGLTHAFHFVHLCRRLPLLLVPQWPSSHPTWWKDKTCWRMKVFFYVLSCMNVERKIQKCRKHMILKNLYPFHLLWNVKNCEYDKNAFSCICFPFFSSGRGSSEQYVNISIKVLI